MYHCAVIKYTGDTSSLVTNCHVSFLNCEEAASETMHQRFNESQQSAWSLSVIELAEHGHATLDPVLRAFASEQRHGNYKVGGVAGGRQRPFPLTGLVQRADKQTLRVVKVLLLSCEGEGSRKSEIKKCSYQSSVIHLIVFKKDLLGFIQMMGIRSNSTLGCCSARTPLMTEASS